MFFIQNLTSMQHAPHITPRHEPHVCFGVAVVSYRPSTEEDSPMKLGVTKVHRPEITAMPYDWRISPYHLQVRWPTLPTASQQLALTLD